MSNGQEQATFPTCVLCGVDLDHALDCLLYLQEHGGLAHARCRDWRGAPFFSLLKLEALRKVWPQLSTTTRAKVFADCQRWGELEREWPGIVDDGVAVEASIRETSRLAMSVGAALRGDPAAKSAMRVLG